MIPDHIEDESYSIVQTRDNGFAICGRAKAARPNQFDALLMKTDGSGNPQWLWIVPGDSIDEAHSVAVDFSGDILVAGWTKAFVVQPVDPANLFVAKFSPAGNFIWSFSYGWINGAEKVVDDRSLVPTFDSGCVVCGPTTSVGQVRQGILSGRSVMAGLTVRKRSLTTVRWYQHLIVVVLYVGQRPVLVRVSQTPIFSL